MKKVLSAVGVLGSFLLPVVALAAPTYQNTFGPFFSQATEFINKTLVPLVFAIAFIAFLWGVFKVFILGGADETKRSEGKNLMLYAIIGFLVMVSLWGIVNLVQTGFGLNNVQPITLPTVPTS